MDRQPQRGADSEQDASSDSSTENLDLRSSPVGQALANTDIDTGRPSRTRQRPTYVNNSLQMLAHTPYTENGIQRIDQSRPEVSEGRQHMAFPKETIPTIHVIGVPDKRISDQTSPKSYAAPASRAFSRSKSAPENTPNTQREQNHRRSFRLNHEKSNEIVQDKSDGFPMEILLTKNTRNYQCGICLMVRNSSVKAKCDHMFCKTCLQKCTSDRTTMAAFTKCPVCVEKGQLQSCYIDQTKVLDYSEDMRMLLVKCVNEIVGCKWRGKLSEYERHASDCTYKAAPGKKCPLCQRRRVTGEGVDDCHEKTCRQRIYICPSCDNGIRVIDRCYHFQSCPRWQMQCNQCGSEPIPREEIDRHVLECRTPRHFCPCGKLFHEGSYQEHIKKCAKGLFGQVSLVVKEAGHNAMSQRVLELQEEVSLLATKLDASERQRQEMECASYDGELQWAISKDIIELCLSKRPLRIFSPSFFTRRGGYKMCVSLHVDEPTQGNLAWKFLLHMMKSHNHLFLQYPFYPTVSLTVLNENDEHNITKQMPQENFTQYANDFMELSGEMAMGCPIASLECDDLGDAGYLKSGFYRIYVTTKDSGFV